MMLGYRSNDAVITVCQNNNTKSIEITEVNKAAEELLGYPSAELVKKPLHRILPPRIGTLLEEYVEFGHDANDVGEVLSKVQSFSIVSRDDKETGFRLKVVRTEATGGHIMFRLVLQDRMGLRKNEALRKAIQDNFKGHEVMDPELDLPDRNSLIKDIELVGYYNSKSDMRTCFAALQLDHYDELFSQYGKGTCLAMMKHVAAIARQNLRPDDVVGVISHKRLGALLLDTTPETARMVSNRLRWQIAANPFSLPDRSTVGLSVSIAFSRVSGRIADKALIEDCVVALDGLSDKSANALIEVDEGDKRKAQ
jgi:GGDEF domain-containing protein